MSFTLVVSLIDQDNFRLKQPWAKVKTFPLGDGESINEVFTVSWWPYEILNISGGIRILVELYQENHKICEDVSELDTNTILSGSEIQSTIHLEFASQKT